LFISQNTAKQTLLLFFYFEVDLRSGRFFASALSRLAQNDITLESNPGLLIFFLEDLLFDFNHIPDY